MQFPKNSEILFSQALIENSVKTLAENISQELKEENPVFISILNGGLMFTAELLKHCVFPLQQDYLHATRYANNVAKEKLQWLATPHHNLENRTILLLDDIFDEGTTLEKVHTYCINKNAKAVYSAVLLNKNKTRSTSYTPDFSALECPNKYVFGMGMDYKGYWRNLPDIYALIDI